MGGRGSNSGGGGGIKSDISRSENIKNQIVDKALNSRIQGIRRQAEEGTGNYTFINAKAVPFEQAEKMTNSKVHERGENTLVEGYLKNGTHVYYANKTESAEIKKLVEKRKNKNQDTELRLPDMKGKETTTYDKWLKKQRKKFDEYWRKV